MAVRPVVFIVRTHARKVMSGTFEPYSSESKRNGEQGGRKGDGSPHSRKKKRITSTQPHAPFASEHMASFLVHATAPQAFQVQSTVAKTKIPHHPRYVGGSPGQADNLFLWDLDAGKTSMHAHSHAVKAAVSKGLLCRLDSLKVPNGQFLPVRNPGCEAGG